MGSNIMYARMGLAIGQSVGSFFSAGREADLKRKVQDFRNFVTDLQAARAQNTVTLNQARVQDTGTQADLLIQRRAIQQEAQQEVSAAAAGITGNTVELIARDLNASEGRARFSQSQEVFQKQSQLGAQKKSIGINATLNRDIQVIPKPSFGAALLGLGSQLVSIYDQSQPEGQRILE